MYSRVLRLPGARRLVLGSVVGRLSLGTSALAFVLLIGPTKSFALAGEAVAAFTLSRGAAAPLLGRLIDRRGSRAVLFPCALAQAAGYLGVAFAVAQDFPHGAIVATAAVTGAVQPPLSACMRNAWRRLAEGELLPAAYALDAVLMELVFITGPLAVAGVVAVSGAAPVMVMLAAATVGGTLVFGSAMPSLPGTTEWPSQSRRSALRVPTVRTLVAVGIPWGVSFALVELALPAFAHERGHPAAGGILIACLGVGSIVGGLLYGRYRWNVSPGARYGGTLALYTFAVAILPWMPSLLTMAPVVLLAGLGLAPGAAAVMALLDDTAPREVATEAYSWIGTSNVVGATIGYVVAGTLIEEIGVRSALLLGAAFAFGAVAIGIMRRDSLAIQARPIQR